MPILSEPPTIHVSDGYVLIDGDGGVASTMTAEAALIFADRLTLAAWKVIADRTARD